MIPSLYCLTVYIVIVRFSETIKLHSQSPNFSVTLALLSVIYFRQAACHSFSLLHLRTHTPRSPHLHHLSVPVCLSVCLSSQPRLSSVGLCVVIIITTHPDRCAAHQHLLWALRKYWILGNHGYRAYYLHQPNWMVEEIGWTIKIIYLRSTVCSCNHVGDFDDDDDDNESIIFANRLLQYCQNKAVLSSFIYLQKVTVSTRKMLWK